MFKHLYFYRLKILFQRRDLLFWTLLFPLILGLFFNVAFSNLSHSTTTSKVGIVAESTTETASFITALNALSNEGKPLFETEIMSVDKATEDLAAGELSGIYFFNDSEISLQINNDQLPQMLLHSFLNQYLQQQDLVQQLTLSNQSLDNTQLAELFTETDYLTTRTAYQADERKNFSFFTLIGMACLFGFMWGLKNSRDEQANQSPNGVRLSVIPVKKILVSVANTTAAFTLFFSEMLLVIAFFYFVYQVNFGPHWPLVLLTVALGSYCAISLGSFFANRFKISKVQQYNVAMAFTMLMSLLAGMFGENPKLFINEHLPLLGFLNPVNLISDSLYQLFYYQSLNAVYLNLGCLGLLALLLSVSEYFSGRTSYYEYV